MIYLRAENLGRRFGERVLFENLELTIAKGERIALIARNGTGKTSLLNILAGREEPDGGGKVIIDKNIEWTYLEQEPRFKEDQRVIDAIFDSEHPKFKTIARYELVQEQLELNPEDINLQNELQELMEQMELLQAWDLDSKVHTILTKLNLHHHLQQPCGKLSGGQRKRLALAKLLITEPKMVILDEPTNHLDIQMIEWLEGWLQSLDLTMLLVSHDRYFLDKICNEIIELDGGKLYTYKGNYAYFLEKKAAREANEAREADIARKLAKKELEWMRKQPKARTTKSKSRINNYYVLKEKGAQKKEEGSVEIQMQMQRLGNKILDVHQLKKSFGKLCVCKEFTHLFVPGERIGIIGQNGVGKSTFLNMLLEQEKPDSGEIVKGETVRFGYYNQQGMQLKDDKRVIEVITDIAEYLEVGKGVQLSATQLLKQFLFDAKKQYNYVSSLSGGEKRRLYLLTVLMKKPNFLVLDEPTNDLDIDTLNVLEDFLENYEGCLLVVTHDRYFMDNLVDSLFVFEGEGIIRSFNGNYQDYLNELEQRKNQSKQEQQKALEPEVKKEEAAAPAAPKKKLSYKEQRELELLTDELEMLQKQKHLLEEKLNQSGTNHEELLALTKDFEAIKAQLDEKELRWLELSEMA
ncbi:MAG: ABC-F family ATP-binding cassette domain-containing protein [Bacteroidia bacterium]|nr:ABC-F family ATP-binding cassette domain-containing protein [Bacteroidia bacterium]